MSHNYALFDFRNISHVNDFAEDNEEEDRKDEESWRPTSGGQIRWLWVTEVDF